MYCLPPTAYPARVSASLRARRVFPYVAWATLAFTLLVILWGTVVRATGSGDGCGESWPKVRSTVHTSESDRRNTHRVLASGIVVRCWPGCGCGIPTRSVGISEASHRAKSRSRIGDDPGHRGAARRITRAVRVG